MHRLALVVTTIAVLSVGCRDQQPVQPPTSAGPAYMISDGAHGGPNSSFFFLPPLVANPVGSPNFVIGAFNPNLSPVVEVCTLAGDPTSGPVDCLMSGGKPVLVFGPTNMPVDGESYHLDWDTQASSLQDNLFYRLIVRGTRKLEPLGFLDLDPVSGGVKNMRTGEVVQFQDGSTLPIKVRIQHGAFGAANPDQFEGDVTNAGGTFTTNTGFAGASFPNNWLPPAAVAAGITDVVLIIERIPVNDPTRSMSCFQTGQLELEGCYRFQTAPDLHRFGPFNTPDRIKNPKAPPEETVIAGVCIEHLTLLGTDAPFEMYRLEETEEASPVLLASAPAGFLTCGKFTTTPPLTLGGLKSGRLLDFASAGWLALKRGITRLVTPQSLYAVDLGAGGSTDGMSRFGWQRSASMTKASTDPQSAPTGTAVASEPKVCLKVTHHGVTSPLEGEPVTFAVVTGGGTVGGVSRKTVLTASSGVEGEDPGCAHAPWVLGGSTSPGGNTLSVTAFAQPNSVTFTATGTSPIQ